jgi:hypothetical protein
MRERKLTSGIKAKWYKTRAMCIAVFGGFASELNFGAAFRVRKRTI